jgi:hypothetical protein
MTRESRLLLMALACLALGAGCLLWIAVAW